MEKLRQPKNLSRIEARLNSRTIQKDVQQQHVHQLKSCHKVKCCLKKQKITHRDFDLSKGFIIEKPGYYCLAENVDFNPINDSIAAITVRSHNVTIDLSTHTLQLTQTAYDTFDNLSGIIVESGFNNFTLKNGYVNRFSDQGVFVNTDNFVSSDHHNILIENVVVSNIGKINTQSAFDIFTRGGININGSTDVLIKNCDVSVVFASDDSEGICCNYCDNIKVIECDTHDNQCSDISGFCVGIGFFEFTNGYIYKCNSLRNSGKQVYSIGPLIGKNLIMEQVVSNFNRSYGGPSNRGGFCAGFTVDSIENSVMRSCEANHNLCEANSLNNSRRNFCTGIQYARLKGGSIIDCRANFNFTASSEQLTGGACVGIDINRCNGTVLQNCFAQENSIFNLTTGIFAGIAAGFDCDFSSNIVHENCTSIANNPRTGSGVSPQGALGFYASIFPEGGPFSNIVFRNCKALNHITEVVGTYAAGFFIGEDPLSPRPSTPRGIVIENCVSENNINTATGNAGFGVGIVLSTGS